MKILMIEDDDAIRDLTQIALTAAGFENIVPAAKLSNSANWSLTHPCTWRCSAGASSI